MMEHCLVLCTNPQQLFIFATTTTTTLCGLLGWAGSLTGAQWQLLSMVSLNRDLLNLGLVKQWPCEQRDKSRSCLAYTITSFFSPLGIIHFARIFQLRIFDTVHLVALAEVTSVH